MAENSESQIIKLTVKTPKDKKDVEVPSTASVKEVRLNMIFFNFYSAIVMEIGRSVTKFSFFPTSMYVI